jgi:hypothetical protein
MEDKQQQQQQQQQDGSTAPAGVRRSSQLVESPLTKETRINTNKNKSPFNRRLLPTQRIVPLLLLWHHLLIENDLPVLFCLLVIQVF